MPAKHGSNRLNAYLQIHETVMERQLRNGFVVSDELVFTPIHNGILLEGDILCQGAIRLQVRKIIKILQGDGADALVQTVAYSYNALLPGIGNIFRYDSPHATHNKEHHVHRYNVLNGGVQFPIEWLTEEEHRPTLGEVIDELADWYYTHYDKVMSLRNLAP